METDGSEWDELIQAGVFKRVEPGAGEGRDGEVKKEVGGTEEEEEEEDWKVGFTVDRVAEAWDGAPDEDRIRSYIKSASFQRLVDAVSGSGGYAVIEEAGEGGVVDGGEGLGGGIVLVEGLDDDVRSDPKKMENFERDLKELQERGVIGSGSLRLENATRDTAAAARAPAAGR
jgi:hypothetical protein